MLLALTRDDTVIRLESRHLQLERTGTESISGVIPLCHLDRVIVDSRAQLSGVVVEALMSRGIPVIVLSRNGQYAGIFHPSGKSDALRRKRQYAFDPERDPSPARWLIEAKLFNQKRVLQRLAAARHVKCPETLQIRAALRSLPRHSDLSGLRGVEGHAAVLYFRALQRFIPEWCAFDGRSRRPPRDPFNSLLSYGYAVMAGELENLILLHGLDPAVGFFHCSQYNTPALAIDLLEPFRPGFCDMLVIGLLTHRRIQPRHFESDPVYGTRLTAKGRRIFFDAWERKRSGRIQTSDPNSVNWQNIWNSQVTGWISFLADGRKPMFFRMH